MSSRLSRAFRLSESERHCRYEIANELRAGAVKFEKSLAAYNSELTAAQQVVQREIDAYNEILARARNLGQRVADRAAEAISCKSVEWQEGERGRAACTFIEQWETLFIDDLEVDFPSDVEIDLPEHALELDKALIDAFAHFRWRWF